MPVCVSGEKETMSYFAAHFEEQLKLYKKQVSFVFNIDQLSVIVMFDQTLYFLL